MFKGRLGLETARVPHADRHGVLWLERGKLYVSEGTLTFVTAGFGDLDAGDYQIPFQNVSNIVIGPGTTISHDALRLLARQGTGLIAAGSRGVRFYAASMPDGQDSSALARRQVELWADPDQRILVTRKMYAMRLGEALPHSDLNALRGVEGHRMKAVYKQLAEQFGVAWSGRRYDRTNPDGDDRINRAINHASAAMRGAAMVAVALTATIPQLGFIHEASASAFALDVADLFRADITLPVAFRAVKRNDTRDWEDIERTTRGLAGKTLRDDKVIPEMIDRIKRLLDGDDDGGDA